MDTSFFNDIANIYGRHATYLMKLWITFNRKLTNSRAQRRLLLKCRTYDRKPKHIQNIYKNLAHFTFQSKTAKIKFKHTIKKLQVHIQNIEIEDINIHIYYLQNRINKIQGDLKKLIPLDILHQFFLTQDNLSQRQTDLYNEKHNKKFSNIVKEKEHSSNNDSGSNTCSTIDNNNNEFKWFHNISNTVIPQDVIDVVSLGQKYSTTTSLNNSIIIDTIKNVEHVFDNNNNFSDENINKIRNTVTQNLHFFKNKNNHVKFEDRVFAQKLKKTETFLKNNEDIFFTMADKGNITVAIDRDSYKRKMYDLLDDNNTYKIVSRNPLKKLQKDVQKIMKSWNDNQFLDKKYHNNALTQTDTSLPKIYGLPKIHKNNIPLRPIVSCIGSPTYKLSKIVDKIIKSSIPSSKSYIKNSFDLINKIQNIEVPDDHVLISLDVTSLFTNVPVELVKLAIQRRYQHIVKHSSVPLQELIEVCTFLMENTFFQFDDKFFQQVYGCPMGNPISPTFADIVMVDLEEECLSKLDFKPLFYYRYVDDIFTCVPKNKVTHMLNIFNSYHERLRFTHEVESEGTINFLEMSFIRDNSKLITNWYHKPTFSGRFLQFNSSHPIHMKKAMIYNLVDKAVLLSDKRFHNSNIKLTRNLLIKNSYPEKFTNFHVKKRLDFQKHKKVTHKKGTTQNFNKTTLQLPYVPQFFEKVSKELKRENINIIPKIHSNLNKYIIRGKDKVDKTMHNNVVYRIECKDCDATYVGETKRHLQTRIKEHYTNTKKDDKHFVINTHIKQMNHEFDFNNVKILDKESNYKKRLTSEMIHIKLQKHPINIQEDTNKLSQHYNSILYTIKKT